MSASQLPPFTHGLEYTEAPNPDWKYGQGVDTTIEGKQWMEGEKNGWKTVDTATEDYGNVYNLMKSGIIPRPVAFVSSISEDGVENLAPFSFFNMVASAPAVISISCAAKPRVKDTWANIKATKGFTVNIISEPWIQQAHACSITAPTEVSEWPLSGLTKEPSLHVKAARVKESAFSMECELLQGIDIMNPKNNTLTTTLILGSVKCIHVRKDMLNERGIVDPTKLKAIARLGDISYGSLSGAFRIPSETWTPEVEEEIKQALDGKD